MRSRASARRKHSSHVALVRERAINGASRTPSGMTVRAHAIGLAARQDERKRSERRRPEYPLVRLEGSL